jgi:hypothetical protein
MCCVVFSLIFSKEKIVKQLITLNKMDDHLQLFAELTDGSDPIKLACIDIFTNIYKNSQMNMTGKFN